MQAGKPKSERLASRAQRAADRPTKRLARLNARRVQRVTLRVKALLNEDRKRAAAQSAAIAEVSAAYILQCANRRAEKQQEHAEKIAARKAEGK